jgi:uncharacterized protein YbjT (DUF2867 family)
MHEGAAITPAASSHRALPVTTTENPNWNPILVLGANGKTGRGIGARLRALGRSARAGLRAGEPRFAWEDRTTWEAALRGTSVVYVSYQPDLAVPGALETVQSFFAHAADLGLRRLVLLARRGETEAEAAERALRGSGADWTILRASWFFQNFSESYFSEPLLAGELALPIENVAEPFVDADDIADVAVAALTFEQAASEIAQATDRDIRFVAVSPQDFRAGMLQAQVPEEVVALVLYLFETVLDGRNTPLANGVQRALGRPPRDFADYVMRTAAAGARMARAELV